MCAGCHGAAGVSAIATFPNLACQKQPYLIGALTDYQSGKRANPVMSGIAKGIEPGRYSECGCVFCRIALWTETLTCASGYETNRGEINERM